jgi:hypothetical protein
MTILSGTGVASQQAKSVEQQGIAIPAAGSAFTLEAEIKYADRSSGH